MTRIMIVVHVQWREGAIILGGRSILERVTASITWLYPIVKANTVTTAMIYVCPSLHTVYPKKYAHGFVVLCFVVVMQSFITNSHEVFIHINQGCFAGTGAIVRLPQCQWSKPDGYGKISQCISKTKHSKAKTVCIFLGIYCTLTIIFSLWSNHLIWEPHTSSKIVMFMWNPITFYTYTIKKLAGHHLVKINLRSTR